MESVVGAGEIELCERGIVDDELGFLGKEDQPEYDEG